MAVSQAIPIARHPFADGSCKRMLIDGKWVEAASGKKFETLNPATGELLATVAEGDAEDINRAVVAARRKVKPFERQNLLLKLAGQSRRARHLYRRAGVRLAPRRRRRPCQGRHHLPAALACRPCLTLVVPAGWRAAGFVR